MVVNAFGFWTKDRAVLKDEQIKKLKRRVGELASVMDILKEAQEGALFPRETFVR